MPKTQAEIEEEEVARAQKAIKWVFSQSEDGETCPFGYCGWRKPFDAKKGLEDHLRLKHFAACVEAEIRQSIDPVRGEEGIEVLHSEGVRIEDTLDPTNPLYIPKEVRDQLKPGERLYLASPAQVAALRDRGYQFVDKPKSDSTRTDADSSDGHFRIREMTVMKIPERLETQRHARKARLNDGLVNRKEQFEARIDGIARNVYERARRNGRNSSEAMNLARAAERGLANGDIRARKS